MAPNIFEQFIIHFIYVCARRYWDFRNWITDIGMELGPISEKIVLGAIGVMVITFIIGRAILNE